MKSGKREGTAGLWERFIWGISTQRVSSPLGASVCCASWQLDCSSPAALPLLLPKACASARQTDPASLSQPKATGSVGRASAGPAEPGSRERTDSVAGIQPLNRRAGAGRGIRHEGCLPAGWLLPLPQTWRQHPSLYGAAC